MFAKSSVKGTNIFGSPGSQTTNGASLLFLEQVYNLVDSVDDAKGRAAKLSPNDLGLNPREILFILLWCVLITN